ncbi:MAG: hypothetical protein QOK30_2498 [Nocardioidaceae bacterium]|jgi:uncharacterized cupredoxin-like copper-binding protein|nr:hypothetical protein [Nocardioidaceae bacterium]
MTRNRALSVVAVFAAVMALGGCSSGGNPVMGSGGDQAMRTESGYHLSTLTCSAPPLPGRTVEVTFADMSMTQMMGGVASRGAHMRLSASPITVAAGRVSLVASNRGWRTHELLILPAPGAAEGRLLPAADGKVTEAGTLGEASRSCSSGKGTGIASGAVGWITLTLPPGRYELICNLKNHYGDGMHQELIVG